jgi:hypothetical protein
MTCQNALPEKIILEGNLKAQDDDWTTNTFA